MNDIVIGSITGYDFDKIKPWVNSLDRSGFTGTKAMICYNVSYETVEELVKRNYTILAFKKDEENKRFVYRDDFSIVVERFLHLWYLLKQYEGKYRYIVSISALRSNSQLCNRLVFTPLKSFSNLPA